MLKLALYYPTEKAEYNVMISTTYSKKRPVVEIYLTKIWDLFYYQDSCIMATLKATAQAILIITWQYWQ